MATLHMRRDRHAFDEARAEKTRNKILNDIAKKGISVDTLETLLGCALADPLFTLNDLGKKPQFMKIMLDLVKLKEEMKKPTNPLMEEADTVDNSAPET